MVKKVITIIIIIILSALILGLVGYFNHDKLAEYIDDENWNVKEPFARVVSDDISSCVGNNYLVTFDGSNINFYNSRSDRFKSTTIASSKVKLYGKGEYTIAHALDTNIIYYYKADDLLWNKKINNDIKDIIIFNNGSFITCFLQNGYKSGISMYDTNGENTLNSYFASTYAIGATVDDSYSHIYIAEVNLSGIKPQSYIRVIDNSTKKETAYFKISSDELITDIDYQNGEVYLLTDKSIFTLNDKDVLNHLYSFNESNTIHAYIAGLKLPCVIEKDISSNVSNKCVVKRFGSKDIEDTIISETPQEVDIANNKVALKVGNEIDIIDGNNNICIRCILKDNTIDIKFIDNGSVLALIYKNKIEFLKT